MFFWGLRECTRNRRLGNRDSAATVTVQIHLKTTIVIPGLEADPTVLPEGIGTLQDLLIDIGKRIHFDFIKPASGDLKDNLEIILNGKEIWFYAAGLDTPLNNEDTVEIYMVPLGGG